MALSSGDTPGVLLQPVQLELQLHTLVRSRKSTCRHALARTRRTRRLLQLRARIWRRFAGAHTLGQSHQMRS